MKLYNITDTREFYDRLAACRGTVELVDETEGKQQILHEAGSYGVLLPLCQIYGKINCIELLFHNDLDRHNILYWLLNKRKPV